MRLRANSRSSATLRRIASILVLAISVATGVAAADPLAPDAPPELSQAERARLEAAGVVDREVPSSDGEGIGVLVMGLVDAPPDQVWSVMADCDAQDEFMPRVVHASVRDRDGDSHTCDLEYDMPYPLGATRTATRHRVRRLTDGGYQRSWDLLPGDWGYRRNRGSWSVHPWLGPGAARSLLVCRMELVPKASLPDWILRAAHSQHAPATFDAIRARVRETAAPRTVKPAAAQ